MRPSHTWSRSDISDDASILAAHSNVLGSSARGSDVNSSACMLSKIALAVDFAGGVGAGDQPRFHARALRAARPPVAELIGPAGLVGDRQLQRGIARVPQPPRQAHDGRRGDAGALGQAAHAVIARLGGGGEQELGDTSISGG